MNQFQFVKIVESGEAVSLILNRPPVNVMNIAMMKEMSSAFSEIQHHSTAKVLLIKAEGKAFSAGVDVADHSAERIDEMMTEFHRLFEIMNGVKIPIIAVVDGAALGGGCELAIFCDMIVASERAKFAVPEIKVGVFPPVAAAVFPRLIGRQKTFELLMNGDAIFATEAERIGLINKVYPTDNFEKSIDEFVSKFTAQSKIILELTKRTIDEGLGKSVMEAMRRVEDIYMKDLMKTEDTNEGLKAFIEKRQPIWKNK
jgi:cyclohexa-1,5-dienecarbonyl-CoA hydratase